MAAQTCIISLRSGVYFGIAAAIINILLMQAHWGLAIAAEKGLDLITCAGTHFDSFDKITAVKQDASWYKGQPVSYENGAIWLNPDPRGARTTAASNIGKVIYKDKVRFKYDKHGAGLVSFSTSFVFQILNTNPYPNCGSGMVFFIADYAQAPERSYGRYFGLVSPTSPYSYRFFAVEFDTHITVDFADPSASHIGIDVNSLKSRVYADSQRPNSSSTESPLYPHLYLYNNYTFTAWIEYDAHTSLIQVWMDNSTSMPRPATPCLSYTFNLSTVFQEYMYVGFSASNNASEDGMEGHVLYAWNFTTYPPASRNQKLLLPLIVPLLMSFALCVCMISLWRKKKHIVAPMHPYSGSSKGGYSGPGPDSLVQYSYRELKKACHRFAEINKVGEGTFSTVYRGALSNGETVAIKRLKEGFRKEREFSSELEIISKLRHRNLLPLLGWCYDKGEALLVSQYMSKGSLSTYLYGELKGTLSSEVRLNILIGVASALEYLHHNLKDCVLHRDVKAANVLLTDKFEPMLGDFGLARFVGHNDIGSVTMTAVGTPGYVAPEVVYTNRATDKSDVYSFGVLALVVASGRPAMLRLTSMPQFEEVLLVDSVWMLHQNDQLMDALDLSMRGSGLAEEEMERWGCVLHVALMCSNPSPELRPTMRQVCQALQGDNFLLMKPLPATRPMYPVTPNWPPAAESSEQNRLLSLSGAGGGLSNSSVLCLQDSTSISASISFDPSNENWVGR